MMEAAYASGGRSVRDLEEDAVLRRAMLTDVMLLGLSVAAPTAAAAESWPARPLTMVVPLGAGSGLDVVGRLLAPRLGEILGQQIIVENVAGAGGMIGAARVAKAVPDGYQFLLGTVGTHAQNQTLYKNPQYNAATDFAPVALIAEQPTVLIARKDFPANSLQEFIAYARANQDKMKYGSAGSGSAAHLACALLNAAIGVDVTHVPYRGGGPALQDLIAGLIDYQCPAVTIALPQIEANLVKAIATLAVNRSASLPKLASAHEQGLAGFDTGIWYALFLPKGTPAVVVRKLNDAAIATLDTVSVRERMTDIGASAVAPERRSPEYLARFVASEIAKWAAPIKAAGISVQ
jgi:tripartite-type tricarboxylate transporter receptor subunit TctC